MLRWLVQLGKLGLSPQRRCNSATEDCDPAARRLARRTEIRSWPTNLRVFGASKSGSAPFKAIRLEASGAEVIATNFDYIEHPKILSQPDADPDQLTRKALDKFLERNTVRGDTVVLGVPGQSGLARFVKLPPSKRRKSTTLSVSRPSSRSRFRSKKSSGTSRRSAPASSRTALPWKRKSACSR